jgi:hypothetical protein
MPRGAPDRCCFDEPLVDVEIFKLAGLDGLWPALQRSALDSCKFAASVTVASVHRRAIVSELHTLTCGVIGRGR